MFLAQSVTIQSILQAFHEHPESIYTWVGIIIVIIGILGIFAIYAIHWIAHHKITFGVLVFMTVIAVIVAALGSGQGSPSTQKSSSTPTISATPTPIPTHTPTPKHR